MFRGFYLCSIVAMFHYYWRIRKPCSFSIMLYNNDTITHNHYTHNYISLYIYNDTIQVPEGPARELRQGN